MRCTIRRGLLGTLFAGGLLALGTTAANAEPVTSGSDGLLSGTQITAPITIPINLGTNSLAILGEANTETTSEAATPGMGTETGTPAAGTGPVTSGPATSGSDGLLSGTQITAPITIPVNLGTNSLAILGEANTETTSEAATPAADTAIGTPAAGTEPVTSGSDGLLSGTQITAPITIPVDLGTNSLAVLGEANTETTSEAATPAADTAIGTPTAGTGPATSGSGGLLSGTQITAPITIPVNLGTNSLAVLGEATTETTTPGPVPPTGPRPGDTDPRPGDTDPRPGDSDPVVIPAGPQPNGSTGTEPAFASAAAEERTGLSLASAVETPQWTSAAAAAASPSLLADTGASGTVLLWVALPLIGAGLALIGRAACRTADL
ncbi:chaplin family protein [Arthrobacter sp. IK3]|uniref:chaplin family protein n=1 Tax=Arthrobacter sp. IK3 TaxID=3448169 RepID=UPI003EE25041